LIINIILFYLTDKWHVLEFDNNLVYITFIISCADYKDVNTSNT